MRLLVIGHSYVTAFAQSKYVAMKQLNSDLKVCLVIPEKVNHVFMQYKPEVATGLTQEEVVSLRGLFGGSHMTYLLDPFRLLRLMKKFKPDNIHIEEDPHSLVAVETVLLARIVCPMARISFFIWDNLARTPKFPINVIKWAFTKFTLNYSSLVVVGNKDGKKLLQEKKGYFGKSLVLPQIGLDSISYLRNGLTLELRNEFLMNPDEILIGFFGRLVPEKGIILLLEALNRLKRLPWRLLIIGSGPLKQEIQFHWQSILGDRLRHLDAVSHIKVPDYLKCLDIFVLPSYGTPRWKEQFGLTLVQAMMAGVACIGSSSGAIPEVLGPGGILFKENDIESLTLVLNKLIQSKEDRDRIGEKAQEIALSRYTNIAVAGAYLDSFKKIN